MDLQWIVIIVTVVVYGIGAVVKARENAKQGVKRPGGREPGTELDRFLQEIEKLRRDQASRPAHSVTEADELPTEDRPVIVVREPFKPPVLRPLAPPPPPPTTLAPPRPAKPPALPAPRVQPPPGKVKAGNSTAAAIGLLKQPDSVATAIVLQEILGPPRAVRRHRQ